MLNVDKQEALKEINFKKKSTLNKNNPVQSPKNSLTKKIK